MKKALAIGFLSLLVCSFADAQRASTMDRSQGDVNGRLGLKVDGRLPSGDLATDGCVLHFVPSADPSNVVDRRCGEFFLLPEAGWYHVWAEQDGYVTPFLARVYFADASFTGHASTAVVPLVKGGKVSVPPQPAGAESFRLAVSNGQQIFEVRHEPGTVPVVAPPGVCIAGFFDANENAVELLDPFSIVAGETSPPTVRGPAPDHGHAVAILDGVEQVRMLPLVGRERSPIPPDVQLTSHGRLVAAWLDLPEGDYRLDVVNRKRTELEQGQNEVRVKVESGSILTVRGNAISRTDAK